MRPDVKVKAAREGISLTAVVTEALAKSLNPGGDGSASSPSSWGPCAAQNSSGFSSDGEQRPRR